MIQQLLGICSIPYATEATEARITKYKRSKGHDNELNGKNSVQEFFTPYEIVKTTAEKVPEEYLPEPTKAFCN